MTLAANRPEHSPEGCRRSPCHGKPQGWGSGGVGIEHACGWQPPCACSWWWCVWRRVALARPAPLLSLAFRVGWRKHSPTRARRWQRSSAEATAAQPDAGHSCSNRRRARRSQQTASRRPTGRRWPRVSGRLPPTSRPAHPRKPLPHHHSPPKRPHTTSAITPTTTPAVAATRTRETTATRTKATKAATDHPTHDPLKRPKPSANRSEPMSPAPPSDHQGHRSHRGGPETC